MSSSSFIVRNYVNCLNAISIFTSHSFMRVSGCLIEIFLVPITRLYIFIDAYFCHSFASVSLCVKLHSFVVFFSVLFLTTSSSGYFYMNTDEIRDLSCCGGGNKANAHASTLNLMHVTCNVLIMRSLLWVNPEPDWKKTSHDRNIVILWIKGLDYSDQVCRLYSPATSPGPAPVLWCACRPLSSLPKKINNWTSDDLAIIVH